MHVQCAHTVCGPVSAHVGSWAHLHTLWGGGGGGGQVNIRVLPSTFFPAHSRKARSAFCRTTSTHTLQECWGRADVHWAGAPPTTTCACAHTPSPDPMVPHYHHDTIPPAHRSAVAVPTCVGWHCDPALQHQQQPLTPHPRHWDRAPPPPRTHPRAPPLHSLGVRV